MTHEERIAPIVKLNLKLLCQCHVYVMRRASDAYILASGTLTITGTRNDDAARRLDERNKGVIFKNCAPFTDCISKLSNTQIDNAKYKDVEMPIYNLIEYSNNYLKTSESLWQYYRDDPNNNITQSESFKNQIKITGKSPADGNTKDVEIAVPLKYLSNFWRTLEMPLINCEINLILTWSKNCVICSATGATRFKIADTKLYVPFVTLSTKDNAKLLQQLKSGKKQLTGINIKQKYQQKDQINI